VQRKPSIPINTYSVYIHTYIHTYIHIYIYIYICELAFAQQTACICNFDIYIYIYIYILDSNMAPYGAGGFVQSKVRSSEVYPNVR